jgi:hypothetical protein
VIAPLESVEPGEFSVLTGCGLVGVTGATHAIVVTDAANAMSETKQTIRTLMCSMEDLLVGKTLQLLRSTHWKSERERGEARFEPG